MLQHVGRHTEISWLVDWPQVFKENSQHLDRSGGEGGDGGLLSGFVRIPPEGGK